MPDPVDIREQVLSAVEACLSALADEDEHLSFYRNPDRDFARRDAPLIAMFDGGDRPEEDNTGRMSLVIGVSVGLLVAGSAEAIGPAINRLRARVRLALSADPSLGGLASDVRYAGAADPVTLTEAGGGLMGMELDFEVESSEAENDPYSL